MPTFKCYLLVHMLHAGLNIRVDLGQNRLGIQLGRDSIDDVLDTGDLRVHLSIEEQRDFFQGKVSGLDPIFPLVYG